MAEFIEMQDNEDNQNDFVDPTKDLEMTETVPTEEPVGQTEENSNQEVENVPDKYRGKTLEEIIRMHQEAEKLIGRQAQEVGEVRKLADSLIKQQLETRSTTPQPETAQEIDFFDDPKKAVQKEVENNPVLKQLQDQLKQQQQIAALQTIEKQHPDFVQIGNSTEFQEWVNASKVRKKLYEAADSFDADAAIELLDTWKALQAVKQQSKAADQTLKKAEDENRSKSLKAAAVQQGGTGESTKPIYRRADLIRLKMTDPARYEMMSEEILVAYAEGRVR